MSGTAAPPEGHEARADLPALLTGVALLALCFYFYGLPVPLGNEFIYLLEPWHKADPTFLASDWSITGRSGGHPLYTTITWLFVELLSPVAAAWLGRVVSWTLLVWALLRLGRKLGLTAPLAGLGIALWLAGGQSLVGDEWLFGGYEAKTLAWAALLWGAVHLLEDRPRLGGALAGLAFSLHAAVGLSGVPALALGLLVMGTPRMALYRALACAVIGALPGVIWVIFLASGSSADRALWEIVVRARMPFHLDPLTFGPQRLLTLAFITLVNLGFAWRHPNRAVRFLGGVVLAGSLIFAAGVLVRLLGWYEWLRMFPFRLLPPIAGLVFLWQAILLLTPPSGERPSRLLRVAALVGLLALPSVVNGVLSMVHRRAWLAEPDDPALIAAFTWLRDSTPPDAMAIVPPWRRDAFWHARRPLMVNWSAIPYTALPEWEERMNALVGPLEPVTRDGLIPSAMAERYKALPEDSVQALALSRGAWFLVTQADYTMPEVFRQGEWRVYDLRREE